MKNMIRITLCGFIFSALFLSSCSFGFVPSWKEKEKAIIAFQFNTLDSIARSNDGSRAIMQGGGFLYIRTLGGPKSDKGPLYGPYTIKADSSFETNDIPAGAYSKGIAVLYSAVELGTFEATMNLPDNQFLTGMDEAGFVDALTGVASFAVSKPKTIKAGQKNDLALTLIPIVNSASTLDVSLIGEYTVTPATTGGSVQKFIRLVNVTKNVPTGDSIKDLACTASGEGTLSRLALYDSAGVLMPNITVNAETNTYTVPYTSGSTFYLYIESSGGVVNLAFNAIYTSGASSAGNVRVSISGATEIGKTVYFHILPTFTSTTSLAAGKFDIESDGTGSGPALSLITGLPITLAPGTYFIWAYIDVNGDAVSGFDGLDLNEPSYISTGTAVTAVQTAIPLVRASFAAYSPYDGDVYYVSDAGSGTNNGSSPANSTTLGNAIVLVNANGVDDGTMNWLVLTENIFTTNNAAIQIPTTLRPVTITSSFGDLYTITLGVNIPGDSFLSVIAGSNLSLMDVTIRGGSTKYAMNGLVRVATSGVFNMLSGAVLTNNRTTSTGPGVNVIGGTFNMSGGVISDCLTTGGSNGGGVSISGGGDFEMVDGSITNCEADLGDGGGVYVTDPSSTFTMSGGSITDCTAGNGSYGGGGVCVSTGSFTMSGGEISGCSTGKSGGGVHIYSGGFTMTGGIISGNSATGSFGGGVCIDGGDMTLGGTAQINGNIAGNYAGGLYLGSGLITFTLSGTPSISENKITAAADAGTGVYITASTASVTARSQLIAANCVTGNTWGYPTSNFSTNQIMP